MKIHLRFTHAHGGSKDWIGRSEGDFVIVQFGKTGETLQERKIGRNATKNRDVNAELRRRADEKRREGYEIVDQESAPPQVTADGRSEISYEIRVHGDRGRAIVDAIVAELSPRLRSEVVRNRLQVYLDTDVLSVPTDESFEGGVVLEDSPLLPLVLILAEAGFAAACRLDAGEVVNMDHPREWAEARRATFDAMWVPALERHGVFKRSIDLALRPVGRTLRRLA